MAVYSIWGGADPPDGAPTQASDSAALTLGTAFTVSEACDATTIRFYFGSGWTLAGNTPVSVALFQAGNATPLASVAWSGDPAAGWNDKAITRTALAVGTTYVAAVFYDGATNAGSPKYSATSAYFTADRVSGIITAPGGAAVNGRYTYASTLSEPVNEFNDSSYYSDVIVETGATTTTTALRPDATVSNGWALTGPATAHEALDEAVTQPTAPDTATDHVSTDTAGAVCEVATADYTLGSGETVSETKLWVYAAGGSKRSITVDLRHGTTSLGTVTVAADAVAAWVSVTSTVELTQAQVNDLRCHLTANSTGGGKATAVTAYAAYVDLTTVSTSTGPAQDLADTLAVSDGVSVAVGGTVGDTLTLADQTTLATSIEQALADTLAVSDTASPGASMSQADSLTVGDSVSPGAERSEADSLAVADSLAWAVGRQVDDTLTLGDALDWAVALSQADAMSLADSLEIAPAFIQADAVGVSDAVTDAPGILVELADTLGITDALNAAVGLSQADTLGLADALTWAVRATQADSLALADALELAIGLSQADALAVADNLSTATSEGATVAIDDALTLSDAVSLSVSASEALADVLALGDALGLGPAFSLADAVGLVDGLALGVGWTAADTLTLADALSIAALVQRVDALAVSDTVDRDIAMLLTDSVALSDALQAVGPVGALLIVSAAIAVRATPSATLARGDHSSTVGIRDAPSGTTTRTDRSASTATRAKPSATVGSPT